MKLNYLSLVFLFTHTALTSPALASSAIIKGTEVKTKDWISHTVVALVSTNQQGQALCSASLVAEDLAITAAHCVTNETPGMKSVLTLAFARDVRFTKDRTLRQIDRVEVPSEWNTSASPERDTSDVAVVHFSGGLPKGYVPSDLLPFDQELVTGEKVVLAGYGISNARANSGAGKLRKKTVQVSNPHFSPSEVELDQRHGGGACHGDSGGPAYVMINRHPYLFGITSRGSGECNETVIYTKIAAYQDWFTRAVKILRK